jgi:hypothetical protein
MSAPHSTSSLTLGERFVGMNLAGPWSDDQLALMRASMVFIDKCHSIRENSKDPEVKRMASVAITEAQTAHMWAVKAATWTAAPAPQLQPKPTKLRIEGLHGYVDEYDDTQTGLEWARQKMTSLSKSGPGHKDKLWRCDLEGNKIELVWEY